MKILIIRLSSLGDIVLTQPIVANFRRLFPKAEIDYLTKPIFKPIVEAFGDIDQIFFWSKHEKLRLINNLASRKYDLVVDLHSKLNTTLIKYLIFPSKIVTYQKKHFLRWLITKKLTSKTIDSTLDLYSSVFDKMNLEFIKNNPILSSQKITREFPKNLKVITIFPGATHQTKRFPDHKYIDLIKKISCKIECKIILLGSKQESELSEKIHQATLKISENKCGNFDLTELIAFLTGIDLMISNDSGPMHIAAALNKKQIAIFGSTSTKLGFKPLNDKAIVFQKNLKCQPCTLHGRKKCPKSHFDCMNSLDIEKIAEKIYSLLIKGQ
ncbi:MAG: lipopolysaccharide heptosyltransferase II [Candidatus Cloacimonetes bacterium]|nr:lipopolysaccharide heptosyltransferase II [Candidatus Cloacimonadota bacterium]